MSDEPLIEKPSPQALKKRLADVMQRDRYRLRRMLERLGAQQTPENYAQWERLQREIQRSLETCVRRNEARPSIAYPQELPVSAAREEIIAAIRDHQVVIVAGETGSGKTTQLPKICLELGRGVAGMIGHTQPRRLAARTVAQRIASELESPLGKYVGYKIRFQDTLEEGAYIKLMTDGVLLAEIPHDRFLDQYDTLIIDEAHERSLNIDFLLGYLKRVLPRRPDLKVIVTSATIDVSRFSRHFENAPIIEVSGRTYPVELLYRPLQSQGEGDDAGNEPADDESEMERGILRAVDEIDALERSAPSTRPRDILVFLPGEGEIRRITTRLRRYNSKQTEILPLYSRLSNTEQNKVFAPHAGRRIVLATNVAETSITVPNIGYVIDTGLARISRYSVRTKVQRLPIEGISQASARQRAGRCGRIAPGVCIRLYGEDEFLQRPEYTEPEILRTNLAAVILQMTGLRLGEVHDFPFVEPPDSRQVNDGYRLLEELGALEGRKSLTEIGRQLLRLPVDPSIGRMLVASQGFSCLREMLIVAAGLSVQDVWLRAHDQQQATDEARKRFAHEKSDFLSMVVLWDACEKERTELSGNAFRKWLLENQLSYLRYIEWRDVHRQLKLLAQELGWKENEQAADYALFHQAVLSGFVVNVGNRDGEKEYNGTRGRRFVIQRGSVLARRKPKWVVAAEMVETQRLYARCVAEIEPEWIELAAAHLIKKSWFEPHWEKKQSAVMAFEQSTLYGLVVVPRRSVHYSRIDPVLCRELFIRHALVAGEYQTRAPWYLHNQQVLRDAAYLEEKSRRRDLLVDDTALYDWYDARVGAEALNGASFEHWRKKAERSQPKLLFLAEQDVLRDPEENTHWQSLPDQIELSGNRLRLDYLFEPGKDQDGITVEVPLAMMNQINAGALEWLVPALEKEKCVALIKSLPKTLRRYFVPAPQYADAFLSSGPDRKQSLKMQFTRFLRQQARADLQIEHWQEQELPEYLRAKIRILDERGKLLKEGHDAETLQRELRGEFRHAVRELQTDQPAGARYTEWKFGEIPREQKTAKGSLIVKTYPALVDQGDGVSLEIFDNPELAEHVMRQGVLRLLLFALPQQARDLAKAPGLKDTFSIQYAHFGSRDDLGVGLCKSAFYQQFLYRQSTPWTEAAFRQRLEQGRSGVMACGARTRKAVAEILERYHRIRMQLSSTEGPARKEAYQDIRYQLEQLLVSNWITVTDPDALMDFPRYLEAIEVRISRLQGNIERDQQAIVVMDRWWKQWQKRCDALKTTQIMVGRLPLELTNFRWLLEEYRVALFAQGIKTRVPMSEKRLAGAWQQVLTSTSL
ncbi:ATP-dependent helicase [gamma proteobacterium HdN1]|nr:ATP-dependent helicase [gamma proteobacterium HdN1]